MKKDKVLLFGGFELPDKNAAAQRIIPLQSHCETLVIRLLYTDLISS